MNTPLCGAKALIDGTDPYNCFWSYNGGYAATYPMTTILIISPFAPFGILGVVFFWSLTVGLLVFAILQRGKPWQLLIFTAAPFYINAYHLQLPVLLAAIYLIPELLPLAMIKPQLAVPLIGTKLTSKRTIGILLFVLLTLIVYPTWPIRWLEMIRSYDGYIPVFVFPTCLLLLPALLSFKDGRVRFILLMALSPQRWIYDTLTFWLFVKNPLQLLILSGMSWVAFFLTGPVFEHYPRMAGEWAILLIYLPLLIMLQWPKLQMYLAKKSIVNDL